MHDHPTSAATPRDLERTLADALESRTASFSVGVPGAIAEFHWAGDDRVQHRDGALALATARGAIRITPLDGTGMARVAARRAGHGGDGVDGAHLVCWLPERRARMDQPRGLTELGPDAGAVRPGDAAQVLFDLGLGLGHLRACVRSADAELLAVLRAHAGHDVLAARSPAMAAIKRHSPHRVFESRLARIEVYQRIPSRARGERTPEGPHTHLLPALLGRPEPVPDGLPADARAVLDVYFTA